jgi:hypothetical protein
MSVSVSQVRVYPFDFIQMLNNSFDAVLDDEIISRLLEIKRNNRFVRCKSPIRLRYKIKDSVAQQWRKEREESSNQSPTEKYEMSIQSNLNKISPKNYSVILEQVVQSYKTFITTIVEDDDPESIRLSRNKGIEILITLIFEKASKEKTYSELYAQLLSDIEKMGYSYISEYCRQKADSLYNDTIKNRIQDCNTEMDEEEIRNVFKTKMKFTGLFLFIANLFVHSIMSYDEVKRYYDGLISYFELAPLEYCDSYIESICQMIRLAGYSLEKSAESKDAFDNDFMKVLYTYQAMKTDENPKMSNKNRFAIMDVTDLYKRGWDMNRGGDEENTESFSSVKETTKKKSRR